MKVQWLRRRLPPCREITFLVSKQRDEKLAAGKSLQVYLHLGICEGCRNFKRQVNNIGGWFQNAPAASTTLTAEARAKLKFLLDCE